MNIIDLLWHSDNNGLLQPPIYFSQFPELVKEKIELLPAKLWQQAIDQYAKDLYWFLVLEKQKEFRSKLNGEDNQEIIREYNALLHPEKYESKPAAKFKLKETVTVDDKKGIIVGVYWRLWQNEGWSYLIEWGVDDCNYYQEKKIIQTTVDTLQ